MDTAISAYRSLPLASTVNKITSATEGVLFEEVLVEDSWINHIAESQSDCKDHQ